jgi:hypothetical protein
MNEKICLRPSGSRRISEIQPDTTAIIRGALSDIFVFGVNRSTCFQKC